MMKSLLTFLLISTLWLLPHLSHGHAVLSAHKMSSDTDPKKIAMDYIKSNLAGWGLTRRDIAEMKVSDIYTDRTSGITRVYFQQHYKGIPVYNAILNVCMTKEGKVYYTTHRFVKDIENKANTVNAGITPQEAIQQFAAHLGITATNVRMKLSNQEDEYVFDGGTFAREDVTTKLVYQPVNGEVRLAWHILFLPVGNLNQWSTRVDALDGNILGQDNWTLFCLSDHTNYEREDEHCETGIVFPQLPQVENNPESRTGVQYNVFAPPFESPQIGPRTMVTNPADSIASPFGWHDTNGQPGHEYTITWGNNVRAYQDRDNLGYSSGDEPDGGPSMQFDFPFELTWEPEQYIDAAVVNLFYWMNYLHDFTYRFGFDEVAGNFQRNNYNRGGQGNDFVWAVAQCEANGDTLHNNAAYYHKIEGSAPSIYMLDFIQLRKYLKVHTPLTVTGNYRTNIPVVGWGQGAYVTNTPVTGEVVLVYDGLDQPSTADACQPILNANELAGKIAMIDRGGGCQFGYKALQAQNAGAIGVIFCNYENVTNTIGAGPDGANVNIPVVMLNVEDVRVLREYAGNGLTVSIVNPGPYVPARFDSDFQNNIIAHEYGHGLSVRLVGGPQIACLDNAEQMGEGWSDFLGLVTTVLPGDTGSKRRGTSTYVTGDDLSGTGYRRFPYSTDMTLSPLTYGDVASGQEEHDLGEVWGAMLWDMYWAFVDQYGWSENAFDETSGNYKAIRLVVDGLKNLSCYPGFVDGRNAILAADTALYNGENGCMIWNVFARRGLGYSADQGSPFDAGDQKEAFDLPPFCTNEILIKKTVTDFIKAGDDITVELTIGNYKSSTATNLIITEELVDGTSYKPGSANFPVTDHGTYLEFTIDEMNAGEELVITYQLHTSSAVKSTRLFIDEVSDNLDSTWLAYTIGNGTANNWFITDTAQAHSGNSSWYIHELNTKSLEALQTNPEKFVFHVAGEQPVLRFYHRYNTKGGIAGGIVEVRETGTLNWQSVTDQILRNGYDSKFDYLTFLASGMQGFTGNCDDYEASYIDLAPWMGKEIEIRFRFASAVNNHEHGQWQIDDIEFMDLVNYNSETCLSSAEGDLVCVKAEEHGTIVDSQGETTDTNSPGSSLNANIYPNPASDIVTFSFACDDMQQIKASILSVEGKELIHKVLEGTGDISISIPIAQLPAGIYIACVQAGMGYYAEKLVVQR